MRRIGLALVGCALLGGGLVGEGLVGCGLLNPLDGYSSGGLPGDDAGEDATSDSSSSADGGSTPDTGSTDAGPSGSGHALVVVGGVVEDGGVVDIRTAGTATLRGDDLGTWKETPIEPFGRIETRVVGAGAEVFVLGPSAYRGTVGASGAPVWNIELGIDRGGYCAVASGGRLFAIGGSSSGTVTSSVVTTPTTPPLDWKPTASLQSGRDYLGCAATDEFVFVAGGKNASGTHLADVFVGTRIGVGISSWRAATPLPSPAYWPNLVVVGSRLFVVGGEFDAHSHQSVFSAPIANDGTLGSWQIGKPLPAERHNASVAAVGSRIVLTGGQAGGAPRSDVFTTTVDPTGAMTDWAAAPPMAGIRMHHGSAFVTIP